jgi:hypothetical protein
MFRKIAPWYSKRFGPASEFNKRVVLVSTRAGFHEILEHYRRWRSQFLDEHGELLPRFRPAEMVASFMQESAAAALRHDGPAVAKRQHIPVPTGPVEVW